ncbi:prenyltransferase [Pontibacillus marinus]|uniref:1,4-dihydroxy-2-naphthoate prenyltransferase n=1 Tax=Pontibacillus marinus BH030004 = DSM 16465 TaxID=1385511 RepID=A0A0A5GKL9_9BACI|nr:prenyltransferase [Pontibacillus marinus]KGX91715.1 1,4-dihydroxy-2-naphthoate prenyltransferase [Pontibacillus marinus BH030004 = DSM 16465]
MYNQALSKLKVGWLLLRSIAVISSSVATIISTILPLFLYYTTSIDTLISTFLLLILGAFLIHGVLTHILNDYIDHESGTDLHSPAILSGGSRVIQTGLISSETLWKLGKWIILILSMIVVAFIIFDYYKLAILLSIGLWGAISYSLPPLRLSYRPFLGEWLSTFPSVLYLGLAGAWLTLDHMPEWALQNAVINALFCISWVMIHHIPDLNADRQASPTKQTSVVWATEKFGIAYSRLPALLYFGLTGLCAIWLGFDRLWAMIGLVSILLTVLFLIAKMQVNDAHQVSIYEKIILILAMVNAVWLGIFI